MNFHSERPRVPAVLMRGGTSKGVFLHDRDLPPAGPERDDLLLRIMGSPDPMQIDGLGGSFSSTSKVVVVDSVDRDRVRYWFAQIGVDTATVDWSGNCGNLTTAVGVFAIEEGVVDAGPDGIRRLVLHNANTGVDIEAEIIVSGGVPATRGSLAIAGVPGTGAPIVTRYLEPAGGVLGALLPTGSAVDRLVVDGVPVDFSLVDATHPYVFVDAADAGLAHDDARTPEQLGADAAFLDRVERIRAAVAVRAGAAPSLAAATAESPIVPRIVLIHPDADADLRVTAFSMGRVHRAVPMTAALCIGAAARIPGTLVAELAGLASSAGAENQVRIRHPKGVATVVVETRGGADMIRSVGVVRTARRLMDGHVYPREH
ncbi:PrpF domain-containing protein [Salinibacterium sp. ZJ70]|uniref:PrpF domain-containing protein n=1 Tax=Salinibacterium sp. ZJ70 TaxID=2708084 RepID=UPI00141F051A|nr:PrpF domain-containing protein [Salinibacterium sp. ZJ70]